MEDRQSPDGDEDHGSVKNEECCLVLHEAAAPAHLHFGDTIEIISIRMTWNNIKADLPVDATNDNSNIGSRQSVDKDFGLLVSCSDHFDIASIGR